jgi:hypothetical protein
MKTAREQAEGPLDGFSSRKAEAKRVRNKDLVGGAYLVLGEVLFTLSPFIAIWMVFYFRGRSLGDLFSQPEWALAASVLSAQAVVKLVAGLLSLPGGRIVAWQLFTFLIAVVIIVGIIPSLIVLSFILSSENEVPAKLIHWQVFCFCVGLFFFVSCHYTGEALRAWGRFWEVTEFSRSGDPGESTRQPLRESTSSAAETASEEVLPPQTQAEYNALIEKRMREAQSQL